MPGTTTCYTQAATTWITCAARRRPVGWRGCGIGHTGGRGCRGKVSGAVRTCGIARFALSRAACRRTRRFRCGTPPKTRWETGSGIGEQGRMHRCDTSGGGGAEGDEMMSSNQGRSLDRWSAEQVLRGDCAAGRSALRALLPAAVAHAHGGELDGEHAAMAASRAARPTLVHPNPETSNDRTHAREAGHRRRTTSLRRKSLRCAVTVRKRAAVFAPSPSARVAARFRVRWNPRQVHVRDAELGITVTPSAHASLATLCD